MAISLGQRIYGLEDFFGMPKGKSLNNSQKSGKVRKIGQSLVVVLEGTSIEIDLDLSYVTRSYLDFIFLVSGRCSYFVADNWVTVDARLLVIPNGVLSKIRLEEEWKVLIVRLPRDAAESMTIRPPRLVSVFERLTLLEQSMFNFANTLLSENGEVSAVQMYAVEQLLIEMGGASLLDRVGGGWGQGAPRTVMLDRAKAIIAQQCTDPLLSPAIVAHEVQSSLRQLQSIFSEADTSIAAEIRQRRAYEAIALLRDARYDVLTTNQIAERSGFSTTTSMRRALMEIYGLTPTQARRQRS